MAGNYLSRDEILSSAVRTRDVEAFGGTLLVREIDALTMQRMMDKGAFITRPDGKSELDFNKINVIELAAKYIVDPETGDPILTKADVEVLSTKGAFDVIAVVTAALEAAGLEVAEEQAPN